MFLGLTYKIWGFIAAGALVIGLAVWGYNHIKDKGAEEVRTEITEQNANLTEHVSNVNENINRRVVTTTENINRNSRDIEEVINDQPSETLSNVSRARLERVREQQRAVRETGR